MIFDYIALNKGNNKVEGEITADDFALARKRLHGMGLTVLAINERKEKLKKGVQNDEKKDYISFEFKGIDKKGKEIVGTIDAKDSLRAYIRLKNEFFFKVIYIFDLAVGEVEKEQQKKELLKELQEKYKLTGLAEEEKEDKKETDKLAEIEKENADKLKILRNQVDIMIAQIKSVLDNAKDEPEKREQIAQINILIGELERVKMSNNIKHIRGVAERILAIAESLFKDKDNEKYKVVATQKENIKSFDLDKLRQIQHREAVEIRGVSGALNKASQLFKAYVGKLNVNFGQDKESVSDKTLKKHVESSKTLLSGMDLLEKSENDLKNGLKESLKDLFSFSKKTNRRVAFVNSKLLFKEYLKKSKESDLKLGNQKRTFLDYLKNLFRFKQLDSSKNDFQKVFIEINNFLGWLLCFYLAYFYLGGIILQKNLGFFKTFFYKTFSSEFLLILLFSFFVFHLLTNFKIKFLRQSFFGALLLFSFGLFSVLLFSLNY